MLGLRTYHVDHLVFELGQIGFRRVNLDRFGNLDQALGDVRLGQLLNSSSPERLVAQGNQANVVVLHEEIRRSVPALELR